MVVFELSILLDRSYDVAMWAKAFEERAPEEILRHAVKEIDNLTFACSFGAEDQVILHMVTKIKPSLPIFYLDTDVLFDETYALIEETKRRFSPNLIRVSPEFTLEQQAQSHGEALWKSRPDLCCDIRKVKPLADHLKGYAGWITGIRRDQAPTRADAQVFEVDEKFGLLKVNPLALWTHKQVWQYLVQNDVPYNPMHDRGFPSIGCSHCTKAVAPGADPRSGRWSEFEKTECGLHQ
ncbi:phosphoadenylyl-sulfate reductase [Ferroacidibacillus organovorans]|uniref:Adenosine 5'-phosphosulfate reductase n=1 Tax=Ferroacidibacillus organovorans TaxID=1765683 RepID=A0A162RT95_9BACL|nr:phosphoadenosine phosphosulfate reductase [Ferroacidibacillus organovorans]OAG87115.1 phosphoadenosine phosphosulfate reductase [Ferroacidibacillus organovorans]OPG15287.1 phosphoadenosine phosphosulfate reductase [Ferroacidibacillus organovorans]